MIALVCVLHGSIWLAQRRNKSNSASVLRCCTVCRRQKDKIELLWRFLCFSISLNAFETNNSLSYLVQLHYTDTYIKRKICNSTKTMGTTSIYIHIWSEIFFVQTEVEWEGEESERAKNYCRHPKTIKQRSAQISASLALTHQFYRWALQIFDAISWFVPREQQFTGHVSEPALFPATFSCALQVKKIKDYCIRFV